MKIKCENVVICGNYHCSWNHEGRCGHNVVALDGSGRCTLEKSKATIPSSKESKITTS